MSGCKATPNQALQQTGAACRLSVIHCRSGGPGYEIDCEIHPDRKHGTGALSMAHKGSCKHDPKTGKKISGSCSGGSQFFITHGPTSHLDGVHTVFGAVTVGQDVVNKIATGDKMTTVTVK